MSYVPGGVVPKIRAVLAVGVQLLETVHWVGRRIHPGDKAERP
eukprot:CAMPEP_0204323530 /NCGR_PEP_ID=MMETSP0469-20131031/9474_1 /ASSEMBLY_ACC=CAM_ASM_000384 /TAXON_ID=2969 /ORGANISM="Oxyrrhis marina" /LENGTH=42 /DNA_ID= /DNA_START= /DNA_END= /DNA_ORIENTATION=